MSDRGNDIERLLAGTFFHGTARRNHAFDRGRVAYLTPKRGLACDHASMDAEIDGGVPVVIEARLPVRVPVVIDEIEMQDLHFRPDRVAAYLAAGHDCAIGIGNDNEIAVFDGASIEIVSVEEIAPAPSP
jgi:hypothetical protein